ncbi:MAG: hypothetical protein V4563_18045 [Pseudomonadota bacterium]
MANPGYAWWVGGDGNVWIKDGSGTRSMGNQYTLGNDGSALFDGGGLISAARINDPNPQKTVTNTAPTQTVAKPVLNQAAVNNTQATIDQLPAILQAALQSEDTTYGNTTSGYNAAEGTQRKTYDASTTTNQQNYDSNFMDSIRAGIKGLGGLMALLRGTGAAGGTVDNQVKDTVGGVTANDIRGGADTQKENQGQLDSSLSTFLTDLEQKRKQADDTHVNNTRSIQRDNATQMQDLFSKMAGYYGDAGMTGQANDFMGRAGALTPTIAANTATQVSAYDTTPVAVQAPQLTAFAAPTQPNVLAAPSDGQVGSGIFTISNNKRKDSTTPAPVAVAQGA